MYKVVLGRMVGVVSSTITLSVRGDDKDEAAHNAEKELFGWSVLTVEPQEPPKGFGTGGRRRRR